MLIQIPLSSVTGLIADFWLKTYLLKTKMIAFFLWGGGEGVFFYYLKIKAISFVKSVDVYIYFFKITMFITER